MQAGRFWKPLLFLVALFSLLFVFSGAVQAATYFSDDFDVSGYIELSTHAPDIGTSWSLLINNGRTLTASSYWDTVRTTSNGANLGCLYQANGTYSSADYEVQMTNVYAGSGTYTRTLAARIQDANNMYILRYSPSYFQIYKRTSGTWTLLGSGSTYPQNNTSSSPYRGDTVGLRVEGNEISGIINSSVIFTVTDSDHTAAGSAGYGTGYVNISTDDSGTGVEADDFIVTSIADTTAPTSSTLTPADNATGISLTANLVISFSEAVDAEAGANNDIVIKKTSDDSVVETIDAQDAQVTGSGTDTITINPTTTLAEQTAYYVQIQADAFDDAANNSFAGITDTTTWSFTTGDFTDPNVSAVSTTPGDTSSTITWTTDEVGSSQVEYGPTPSYGSTTSETDTTPRVTSHSVNVTSLLSCRRYYYRVKSTDGSSNQTVSSQGTFETTGCAVTSIDSGTESSITTLAGGEFELTNNNSVAKLTIPDGFAAEDADFQINRLSTSGLPTAPTGTNLADENIFDLSAVTASNSDLTSFIKNVTFVVTYGSDTESSFDESTLDVYKYNSGTSSWDDQNCTLDTTANTLTCELSGFSTYGVFGEQTSDAGSTSSSGGSSVSSNEPAPTICTDPAPGNAPDLFQTEATLSTATLYFAPATQISDYYISYSESPSAEEHGASVSLDYDGVQKFTVELLRPNTTYYFKVRGQNGCMPGEWSQILQATTLKITAVESISNQVLGASANPDTAMFGEQPAQDLPSAESTQAQPEEEKLGTDLTIRVEQDGQPVSGARVELHSQPRYDTTDENGRVFFERVEPGDHTLKLAYADYQAEQQIAISGEQEAEEVVVNVTLINETSWQDYLLIGSGGFISAVVVHWLWLLIKKA